MYTDEDLYSAVKEGIFEEESVEKFRKYMELESNTLVVDEENFRLISGFNDIFVAIASFLFLISSGWLAALFNAALGWFVAASIAWGLSVYFVLRRRLALPAILFLAAFVVGSMGFAMTALKQLDVDSGISVLIATAFAAFMAWMHWLKFKVPITVAAGVGCIVGFAISVFATQFPEWGSAINRVVVVCGVFAFAIAMYWDSRDVERKSRRSDVAFWLHLLAAPLIVHPIFAMLGILGGTVELPAIIVVIGMYALLGFVSIVIDRRALMVSALIYVIYAFAALFRNYGVVSNGFAVAGVFIGAMLLFLSAAWHVVRARLLDVLPVAVTRYLPAARHA